MRYNKSITEIPLVWGEIEEDCLIFVCWYGDFIDQECNSVFGAYVDEKIDPDKISKR